LADVRQQLTQYHDALSGLGPTKAQVVYLCDVLGHGLEDVAATLGISVAATQSRLVRGRKEVGDVVAALQRRRDADPDLEEPVPRSGDRWRAVTGKNEPSFGVESSASSTENTVAASGRCRIRGGRASG
jgi:hypothetical protein